MHNMEGWHWGFGFGHWFFGILFWGVILLVLLFLAKNLFGEKR